MILFGRFDASVTFVLLRFIGDVWCLYLDVVHYVIHFHFVVVFFVISGIFARKVCFISHIHCFTIVCPCLFRHSHG